MRKVKESKVVSEGMEEVASPALPAAFKIEAPQGVDVDTLGQDHPLAAVTFAEENNLGPNNTIVDLFTPEEKFRLMKMMKHGEFTQQEAAVLKYLMSEAGNLNDIAVMLGAKSTRTKGKPMTRSAALMELNRILTVIAKRSKAKLGKAVDLSKIAAYKREMKKQAIEKKRKEREAKRAARAAYKEFWDLLRDLQKTQREYGLPVSRYDKVYTTQKAGMYSA